MWVVTNKQKACSLDTACDLWPHGVQGVGPCARASACARAASLQGAVGPIEVSPDGKGCGADMTPSQRTRNWTVSGRGAGRGADRRHDAAHGEQQLTQPHLEVILLDEAGSTL